MPCGKFKEEKEMQGKRWTNEGKAEAGISGG